MKGSRLCLGVVSAAAFLFSFASCTEQHRPEEHRAAIKNERLRANAPVQRLTAEGKIPTQGSAAEAPQGSGNPKYDMLCASCHGLNGAADTPTAKALSPQPRNFTDVAWQDSVDDARIAKVIKEGGASVGLSAGMAPWGAMLDAGELEAMVKTVRSFRK